MIINDKETGCFTEYADPVRVLEQAFNAAGLPVEFALFVSPGGVKYAEVIYPKPPDGYYGNLLNLSDISLPKALALMGYMVRAEGL